MRRTNQEFKAEVMRRSDAYRALRKKRRRRLMNTALCVVLVMIGAVLSLPFMMGMGGSTDNAAGAEEPMAGDGYYAADEAWPEEKFQVPGATAEQSYSSSSTISSECIILTVGDEAVLIQYLKGDWIGDGTNCAFDYTLDLYGATYLYHSECGTFRNTEENRSLTVSEDERLEINEILEKYENP